MLMLTRARPLALPGLLPLKRLLPLLLPRLAATKNFAQRGDHRLLA